jgi:hypothetical protein
MQRGLVAMMCAVLASGVIAQAQDIETLPTGFVGPQHVASALPFVASGQEWMRGDETIALTQEVPLGARIPGFPMPNMSEPSCKANTATSTEHRAGVSPNTYYIHDVRYSNVGGDYFLVFSKPGTNAVPSDVQTFFESMCKQWIGQDALSVAATPLPPPAVARPPSGFMGGTFSPDAGSLGLWFANWLRGHERITITTLKHPVHADPDPHFSSDPMTYQILSRSHVDGCERTNAVIVDYVMTVTEIGVPSPFRVTHVHALYVAGSNPLIATYASRGSNAFPSDVRKVLYVAVLYELTRSRPL